MKMEKKRGGSGLGTSFADPPLDKALLDDDDELDPRTLPRGKWSKQDTEKFYKAVSLFGTDFSTMQMLFPEKTRNEVKLKYKKEERHHPLHLSDAINNCAKDLCYFKLVIERIQQNSAKAEQDAGRDALDFMLGEEVEDSTPGTNSFMDKKGHRGKWSKQDTEKFYKAVSLFGTDFSMMQLLFPEKTRNEVKLKYKKEEGNHPLHLSDAIDNCAKDLSYFKLVIERMQQISTKAEQDAGRDTLDFMLGEKVEHSAPRTNEEVATTKQDEEDFVAFHTPEQSDDSDDNLERWSRNKSDY